MRRVSLFALLLLLVWGRTLHDGTVDFDTPWLVVDNPILSPGRLSAIPTILWDLSPGTRLSLGAEYLPVRDLTVLADFAVFGRHWVGHHAQNLAWYLLACGLFLGVVRRLLPAEREGALGWRALAAALLFAVHPVHLESVAWLASRKDVVSLALFMAALLSWLRGRRDLPVLLYLFALWSKSTAVVLPGVLVLLSLLHEHQDPRRWRWWTQWLPYAVVALVSLALSTRVGAQLALYAEPRAGSALGLAGLEATVWVDYLRTLLWPSGLAVLHADPAPTLWAPLVLVGLLAIALASLRRRPLVALGLGWFAVGLLPVSQIVPLQNLVADRYLLLPSAGLALALAAAWPRRLRLLLPLAAVALSAWTWVRAADWQSSTALWRRVTQVEPGVARGWTGLAGARVEAGDLTGAERAIDAGMDVLPDDSALLQSRGWVRMKTGDLAGAEADLRRAFGQDPGRRKAGANLVMLLTRQARLEEAVAVGERLVSVHPLYARGWTALGVALLQMDALERAREALLSAHQLAPYDADVVYDLGAVQWRAQDSEGARTWWEQALRLDPTHTAARRGIEQLDR